MNSMTGFGQASGSNEHHRIGVALYAVNHRFLDLALRVGDEYRICEPALRELMTPPDPPKRPIGFVTPEDKKKG